MGMHLNWRDCDAWRQEGLPLSTTSNEAAKLYDAAITQMLAWYDEPSVGGIGETMSNMFKADPDFVMGRALKMAATVAGSKRIFRLDYELRKEMDDLEALALRSSITDREWRHVNAVKLRAEGEIEKSTEAYADILVDHPTDITAIFFSHFGYFWKGDCIGLRDNIGKVILQWKPSTPLYGYLHGLYAFGLEESNIYDRAEEESKKALDYNYRDSWATHTMAHVYEMKAEPELGIKWLNDTENGWVQSNHFAGHHYWHKSLFHVAKGDYEGALGLFDEQLSGNRKRPAADWGPLDMTDATGLLKRLEFEGVNVEDRYEILCDAAEMHTDDHCHLFNDLHYLMAFLNGNKPELASKIADSLREYAKDCTVGDNAQSTREFGIPLMEGIMAYSNGDYDDVVEKFYPNRYKFRTSGGSHAQRDIFHLLLLNAAVNSNSPRNQRIAKSLILERKSSRPGCSQTERLYNRLMARHELQE